MLQKVFQNTIFMKVKPDKLGVGGTKLYLSLTLQYLKGTVYDTINNFFF